LLAIDTHFGIDVELGRTRFRVDAGDRADVHARSIVGAQTGDDVRHGFFPYLRFKTFKWFKKFKTCGTT
jgi:hypothetical protein